MKYELLYGFEFEIYIAGEPIKYPTIYSAPLKSYISILCFMSRLKWFLLKHSIDMSTISSEGKRRSIE